MVAINLGGPFPLKHCQFDLSATQVEDYVSNRLKSEG